ncbi:MAG: hypothetical protein CBD42_005215 [Gammaproteobacteria bacterium TMED182]|nr:hypothetical protein [Gammaproteobacteria bacterium]RPG52825.1 MAG: hypothetical protein CBD42_005215 [Gammaproteobacteria bacterium TMED182]
MSDGIAMARRGLPALALVTEAFWPQGDFVATSLGMPDIPRLKLPHPIAGTGQERMLQVAERLTDSMLEALST